MMTQYEIIDHVSRFIKRFGMLMDPETMNKARDEAGEYDFRLISPGHYGVIHGSKMYVIIEREGQIGCSCEDMTFNHQDGTCCKHLIAFSRLMTPITKQIDKLDAAHLMNVCGWTGRDLHPEEIQIPPDPDLDLGVGDPLPEPEPETSVKCQYCNMGFTGQAQEKADAWLREHEAKCAKNPVNVRDNPKLLSTNCQYCGKAIKRKLAADLKQAIKAHEATCPKRPKGEDITQEETDSTKQKKEEKKMKGSTTAVSTGHDMPDEREFTNRKVRNYVENRGGFYKAAGGKEVPDSAAMSIYALDTCRISTETILIEKNADQAKAIVRGHKGGVSVDASVILRFDVLRRRELLKMAKKYSAAIIGWSEEMMPILDLNFMLTDRTPVINLGEHMINFAIDQEQFADRTAETLARRRAFDMLTGVDWRDAAEVQAEDADAAAMGNKKE